MRSVHILVVDDDRELRETIIELLMEEGHEITAASNGGEALEALRGDPLPGLILLDLMMPGVDGHEFRARQLADPRIAHIPVIGMSAGAHDDERVRSLQAQAFMRKPFDFRLLVSLIERHVAS